MKLNWGWKIAILYTTFVAGIMFMVIKARSEKVELVVPDYYNQELKHEGLMLATRNAMSLSSGVRIAQENNTIKITMPEECVVQHAQGNVKLYCPADMLADKDFALEFDSTGSQWVDISQAKKGLNMIKISWRMADKDYYHEQTLYIN